MNQTEMHLHRVQFRIEEVQKEAMWAKHILEASPDSAGASLEVAHAASKQLTESIKDALDTLREEDDADEPSRVRGDTYRDHLARELSGLLDAGKQHGDRAREISRILHSHHPALDMTAGEAIDATERILERRPPAEWCWEFLSGLPKRPRGNATA